MNHVTFHLHGFGHYKSCLQILALLLTRGLDVYTPWAGRCARYEADPGYLDPGSHNFWLHEPLSSFRRTEKESASLVYEAWQKQHHSLSL